MVLQLLFIIAMWLCIHIITPYGWCLPAQLNLSCVFVSIHKQEKPLAVFTDVSTASRTLLVDFPPLLQVSKMTSMGTALTPGIQATHHFVTHTTHSTFRTVATVTEPTCSLQKLATLSTASVYCCGLLV